MEKPHRHPAFHPTQFVVSGSRAASYHRYTAYPLLHQYRSSQLKLGKYARRWRAIHVTSAV
jgi:hypothetical protein